MKSTSMKNGKGRKLSLTPSFRLHFNLLAMHDCPIRMNGGAGVSIKIPEVKLSVEAASEVNFEATLEILDVASKHIAFLTAFADDFPVKVNVKVPDNYPLHIGLGGGTSLRLSVIESLYIVNGLDYTQHDILLASGRGGTSGVGVHTFFDGGFVLDAGRKSKPGLKLLPSSVQSIDELPLKLVSADFPSWYVKVLIPKGESGLNSELEVDFFNRTCPIREFDAFESVYFSVFGIATSVIESDFERFKESIIRTQKTKWKSSEINTHGNIVHKLLHDINSISGVVSGMSSMGPGIYCISPKKQILDSIELKYGLDTFQVLDVVVDNLGREVRVV